MTNERLRRRIQSWEIPMEKSPIAFPGLDDVFVDVKRPGKIEVFVKVEHEPDLETLIRYFDKKQIHHGQKGEFQIGLYVKLKRSELLELAEEPYVHNIWGGEKAHPRITQRKWRSHYSGGGGMG